jgi:tRNA 2-thiouridine synthesizing protein A
MVDCPLTGPTPDVTVDARDELCPRPLLMAKSALRKAAAGDLIEVIVNDRTSKENVLSYCYTSNEEVVRSWDEGPVFHVFIRKASGADGTIPRSPRS